MVSDADITQDNLEGFLSRHGRRFYKLPEMGLGRRKIVLERRGEVVPGSIRLEDGDADVEVGVSRAGMEVWSLRWEGALC